MVGGFRLVPSATPFSLTLRPHASDGKTPLITSGQLVIDAGSNRRPEAIGSKGEANFKEIPPNVWGTTVQVIPLVNGYEQTPQFIKIDRTAIDIALVRLHPRTTLTGSIVPVPAQEDLARIKIVVDGHPGDASPDALGRFSFTVDGQDGDRVRIRAFRDREVAYDEYQTLPGPVTITMPRR